MSKTARRSDRPKNVWKSASSPVRIGDERLRFIGRRRNGQEIPLDDVCTSVGWDDVAMELTGSIELNVPAGRLKLADGDVVRAEYAPSDRAAFRRLWTMTLGGRDSDGLTKAIEDDSLTAALTSTLSRFRGHRMDFHYRRDKAHPKGWTCDQIVRDVARRTGIPLGKVARGTHRIRNLVRRDADPMDLIVLAYKAEREDTGRRYVATWNGRLNVRRLTRSEHLLELLPVLLTGSYTVQRRPDFATVLNVRTTAKHGKRKARKIRVRVRDSAAIKRYGVITRTVHPRGIDTEAEAVKWARRSLRTRLTLKRELSLVVPLMPTLTRGAALRVRWQDEGLEQVVFVRSCSHQWQPGGGTTTITVRFDDPFVDERAKKNARKKAAAARRHGRPLASSAKGADAERRQSVQPIKARRRGDK